MVVPQQQPAGIRQNMAAYIVASVLTEPKTNAKGCFCMATRVTVSEASKLTGLTEYTPRQRIKQGRFPHIRTSGDRGNVLIDIELLNRYLEQEAIDNINDRQEQKQAQEIVYGKLRVVAE